MFEYKCSILRKTFNPCLSKLLTFNINAPERGQTIEGKIMNNKAHLDYRTEQALGYDFFRVNNDVYGTRGM